MSLVVRKPVFGVSEQVLHKPGCTITEDSQRLQISDLGRKGFLLSVLRKQRRWSASGLARSWSAALFSHMQKADFFLWRGSYISHWQKNLQHAMVNILKALKRTVMIGTTKQSTWPHLQESEPCREKPRLGGFQADQTQTGLYSHRRWLVWLEISDCTI